MKQLLIPELSWFIVLLIFCIIFYLSPITAAEEVEHQPRVMMIEDEVGDDYGPGSYQYPLSRDFSPREGLLDITEVQLEKVEDNYNFIFSFNKITNPWEKPTGFSHPLIEVYIDNQPGGATHSFQQAARVDFSDENPWNKMLKISSEFVRLYTPEDEDNREEVIELTGDISLSHWELEGAELYSEGEEIILTLDREHLYPLQGAKMYILVGSFDPFGPGYYREVKSSARQLYIFDTDLNRQEVDVAPRVMDIILPEQKEQTEVLNTYDEEKESYAVVYPVEIDFSSEEKEELREIILLMSISIFIILLIIIGYLKINNKFIFDSSR